MNYSEKCIYLYFFSVHPFNLISYDIETTISLPLVNIIYMYKY